MFPQKEGVGGDWRAYRAAVETAKQICDGCPRQLPCYATAVENREEHGVWGGVLFTADRHRKPANSGECGTEAGWARHARQAKKDGTTVTCQPCLQARSAAKTVRARKYREEKRPPPYEPPGADLSTQAPDRFHHYSTKIRW